MSWSKSTLQFSSYLQKVCGLLLKCSNSTTDLVNKYKYYQCVKYIQDIHMAKNLYLED